MCAPKVPDVSKYFSDIRIPKMFKVKQNFDRRKIERDDIPEIIFNLLNDPKFADRVRPGMRIAITAGSRGIANNDLTTKTIAEWVKSRGGKPFIVPAMGSHGGATAEGQKEILAGYGITEEYCGCPVISSMETVKIGQTDEKNPRDVYIDKNAAEADGIILGCRVKPHTAFRGPYESGLMKMMAIGLGKQHGAQACHEQGFGRMDINVPLFGKCILKNAPVLFGVPTIENAYDETCKIAAVAAEDIEKEEPYLLKEAFSYMPRILVPETDVLIVDYIGKNFSGDGMDPNITGTFCTPYATGGIKSQRVVVLDVSPESHGNGIGLGFASATTKRVYDQLDLAQMYTNAITCTVHGGARIPLVLNNAREAIQCCIKTLTPVIDEKHDILRYINKESAFVVRIPNSLHLEHIMLSEAYFEDVKAGKYPGIEIESEPEYMSFDEKGELF